MIKPKAKYLLSYLALGLTLLLVACSPARRSQKTMVNPTQVASKQLHELFAQEQQLSLESSWFPDISPTAQHTRLTDWRMLHNRLATIQKESLSRQDKISYDIFRFVLDDRIRRLELKDYFLSFNAEGGFFTELTFRQRAFRFDHYKSYEDYLTMLAEFKGYMERNMQLLREGVELGITQPRLIAEKYEPLIQTFLEPGIEQGFLYEPLTRIPAHITENGRAELQDRARQIIRDSILVAYRGFDRFMQEEYLPQCRQDLGITTLPNGKMYYEHLVQYFTTLPMSSDEIFAIGEKEVARIEKDMQKLIAQTGFSGSFAEFLEFLRTDSKFYAQSPEELLMRAAYLSKQIDGLLPNYFYKLPRLPYGVQPVPADIAPNYTGGRYSPGSTKAHRAGNYWINTYKLESRPLYVLPALTLHEAVPGHHLQIALAQEMEEVPDFRRELYLSSYGEGWALYCEWLGVEMGIYKTPYERFGRLSYEMWRACRLVVDVGLHAKGWTREQAVEYLASRTALSLHEVNTEVDRYIGWPGQALSYKMGELKIRELREKAKVKTGSNFDLRDFHDLLLENGAVPLFVLEEMVEEYIEGNLP